MSSSESPAARMFTQRVDVLGQWVAVMEHRRTHRGIILSPWHTRCLRSGEIHELIICLPQPAMEAIDEVAYLGFAEITSGGVVATGDDLWIGPRWIGCVLGFDETHFPNHYNILIAGEELITGAGSGISVGENLAFRAGR